MLYSCSIFYILLSFPKRCLNILPYIRMLAQAYLCSEMTLLLSLEGSPGLKP